jgi:DNA-binding NarL/FixJ family response regulator
MIRIIIADDQPLMRDGLKTILELEEDMEVSGLAGNGVEACELAEQYTPDLILMDIRMPVMDGVTAVKKIKAVLPETAVIMLTTFDDDRYIADALSCGANGFFLKDIETEKLIEIVRRAAAGEVLIPASVAARLASSLARRTQQKRVSEDECLNCLTDREKDICGLLVKGMSNQDIADALHLSIGTVKNYVSIIYDKTGITSRSKLLLYLQEIEQE